MSCATVARRPEADKLDRAAPLTAPAFVRIHFTMSHQPSDPFDLNRFVEAQTPVYRNALAELQAGAKRSHWMWFIFPQVEGLGSSAMAQRYAIHSREEALAYLAHPVLGARLRECAAALLQVTGRSIEQIMGYPDDMKLRSSMTLFAEIAPEEAAFQAVLDKYFGGERDAQTLRFLSAGPAAH